MAGVSQVMAGFLSRRRQSLNHAFQQTRHVCPGLAAEEVTAFVVEDLQPVVEALSTQAPHAMEETAEAIYVLALPLIAKGWLGPKARCPAVARGWSSLLAANARWLAGEVEAVAGGLLNALHQLENLSPQGISFWVDHMNRLGSDCPDQATFLELGRLLAWRAGLAHYRPLALTRLASLPPALVTAVFGFTLSNTDRHRMEQDPWWSPGQVTDDLRLVGRVGGFRGFGGPFQRPPKIFMAQEQFLATDSFGVWLFSADVWGATLVAQGQLQIEPEVFGGKAKFTPSGRLQWGNSEHLFPEAVDATSCWANSHTCVVTVSHSHHLLVFARSPGHG